MADEVTEDIKAISEAPAKVTEAIVESVADVTKAAVAAAAPVEMPVKAAPVKAAPVKAAPVKMPATTTPVKARKLSKRRVKPAVVAEAPRRVGRPKGSKNKSTLLKTKLAVRQPVRVAKERIQIVATTKKFDGFDSVPGFAPITDLLSKASGKSQEYVKRSQKVAEEFADLARANVEAIVESGKVAAEGAKSIGQEAISSSRAGFEQAAGAIRSLAEAKSPTEYMQLQSEFARSSFDRMVSESSKLTESMVKLAGEAFQPLSNRASANAERFNSFVA